MPYSPSIEPDRPRRQPAIDYLLAALITTAFSAFMVYGFRYADAKDNQPGIERKPQVAPLVMLAVGDVVPPERSYQRKIEAWAELRDPTLMSLPNDTYGFSEILRIGFERPLYKLPPRDPTLELAPSYAFPPLDVTVPAESPMASLDKSRLREPLTLPKVIAPKPPKPGVYWTTPDGVVFHRLPPPSLPATVDAKHPVDASRPTRLLTMPRVAGGGEKTEEELRDRLAKDMETGLVSVRHGRLLRVKILQSCGNPTLDQLAVDQVRRHAVSYPDMLKTTDDLDWWLGSEHELVVHWRFATGVRNTADPTTKEDWHDRGWY